MAPVHSERRLAAIVFTDIVGYTALMAGDEAAGRRVRNRHEEVVRPLADQHHGQVVDENGDELVLSFPSALDAVSCAQAVQDELREDAELRLRIGIHLGDIVFEGGRVYGDGVNVASRIRPFAEPGGICISEQVHDSIKNQPNVKASSLGRQELKNVARPMEIFAVRAESAAPAQPPLDPFPTQVPGTATNVSPSYESLVGRSADFDAVRSLLAEHRLVTVVGVGGIGKTRLALDIARAMVSELEDGVWWCELAPVGEVEAVVHSIGNVLGARQHPGRSMVESLAEFCRRRELLLVFDNCEHVLDAAGELVEALVNIAPRATVLATSREAIGCRGEQAYPLPSLGVGGDGSPAFELFARRAAEVMPGRHWSADEQQAIRRICRRLDGMPLAIELAAGRVRSLSPSEIEERLDAAFRVLRGGRRSIERHRTLEAAIDWSYELLEDVEASLFERLSVFAGGWGLRAAEAVCGDDDLIDQADVADLLDNLVSKSLVVADHGSHGTTRYRLLEPLRQYAEARLAVRGDALQLRAAHAAYFCRWSERWAEKSWSDELAWRLAVEREFANLRAAIAWAIDSGGEDPALRTIAAIERGQGPFLWLEMADWAKQAVELPAAADHPLGPQVCGAGAAGFWWRNDLATATELVDRGEAMACYDASAFQTNSMRFVLRLVQGDPTAFEVADRIALGDPSTAAVSFYRSGFHPEPRPDDVTNLRSLEAATGSEIVGIMADQAEAWMALRTNDRGRSAALLRRAITRAGELGARFFIHMSVAGLGQTAGVIGLLTAADLEMVRLSLREQRDCGQEMDQWLVLGTAAVGLMQHGNRSLATEIYRGLCASTWGSAPTTQDLGEVLFDGDSDLQTDGDAPVLELATLVDAVIGELDTILAGDRRS